MLPTQPHLTPHHSSNALRRSPSASVPMKRSRSQFEHDNPSSSGVPSNVLGKKDHEHDDARKVRNKSLYIRLQDTAVGRLFEGGSALCSGSNDRNTIAGQGSQRKDEPKVAPVPKRVVRVIAEDDYGDDEDEEDESPKSPTSPLRARNAPTFKFDAPTTPSRGTSLSRITTAASSQDQAKSSEDARKQLEEEKKAGEEAAKNSFQTRFFTLESDRDAMLEQQKLDELDRQVEAEAAGEEAAAGKEDGEVAGPKQGTLSSTNLGASSLTLKHLIGRIDAKRVAVQASDQQLRSLMSEVRKNRSKWANEERVGQEELYESAERVLAELKARTEWSAPFLQKVNRREAPDYYNIIKTPMDLGTMLKKLKSLGYQSKKEFCRDLDLIWNNCFEYNKSPENFLRKKAEQMKKETAKLVPLIPDIVIRSRAQVEAEERRLQTEFDDAEDSDDEPLKTTRGRKAPGKSSKKGANIPRKAPPTDEAAPPAPDIKTQDILANLKNGHLKNDTDSTREGSLLGFSTPPRGDTPMILTGAASQADHSEVEMPDVSILGTTNSEELDQEDDEYKTWKQVTKRERAEVAAMRHRLFRGDKVNPDEPAVVRSKAGMRRWMRLQKTFTPESAQSLSIVDESPSGKDGAATTLQEEIDDADEGLLPDYYDSTAAVPQLEERTSWKEDLDGQVIEQREECLRVIPKGYFVSLKSQLTSKIDSNMRQMQETRKIVAKIAIVKQMQVQTQTYQNQFQKYEPSPFVEADILPTVVSDDGPIMNPWVCRAALKRSVGKLFYHAGFEEFQPAALDVVTDLAAEYFANLVNTLTSYSETVPKVYRTSAVSPTPAAPSSLRTTALVPPISSPPVMVRTLSPRFTHEEAILHTLRISGHDLESLSSYIHDDTDRLTSKLEAHHTRTRDYLAELLRPALDPNNVGADGVGAFADNSEQFVGGDFAEDIGEDFFGFKELGLDKEFGLAGLGVPLHLLQSRIQTSQPGAHAIAASTAVVMEAPEPYTPVTYESLSGQIGIVQEYFRNKLNTLASAKPDDEREDLQLVEDDELPVKQRFPKPRLPPTGKISSPRKRPIREQQMMARKKRRLEAEAAKEKERQAAAGSTGDGEDQNGGGGSQRGSVAEGAGGSAEPNINRALDDADASMPDVTNKDDSVSPTSGPVAKEVPTTQLQNKRPISKLKFEVPQEEPPTTTGPLKGDPEKPQPPQKKELTNSINTLQGRVQSGIEMDDIDADGEPDAEGEEDDEILLGQQNALNGFKSPPVVSAHS